MATNQNYDSKKYVTVKEALQITGYANAYLRMKLLKEGKIAHVKENIPGTVVPRILIERESLERWMKEHPRGSKTQLTEDMKQALRDAGYEIQ